MIVGRSPDRAASRSVRKRRNKIRTRHQPWKSHTFRRRREWGVRQAPSLSASNWPEGGAPPECKWRILLSKNILDITPLPSSQVEGRGERADVLLRCWAASGRRDRRRRARVSRVAQKSFFFSGFLNRAIFELGVVQKLRGKVENTEGTARLCNSAEARRGRPAHAVSAKGRASERRLCPVYVSPPSTRHSLHVSEATRPSTTSVFHRVWD